ncbi:tail fiber protein [Salmonella enterica]|nr:tail fiber protein [Salmonella enterica]EHL6877519.1 tail fiber protein [Salmonella enterica]EHL6892564.1 tail fiber protein [Salmonella enterica]EHL6906376.1 tail fiber protein [Salmonella enterica]EIB2625025.1 tail fiber protein [Salmonella enterica]
MKPLMKPIDTPDQVFHDGDPSTGELGTICSAEWLNNTQASIRDIQAECIAILRANGVEPDETKRDQLWEAIRTAIKSHVPAASLAESGIVQLSGSVTSDSESIAATSKAVKIAMDNANARLAKDRNLADLTNVQVARQSLGLGNSATRNLGTAPGTVAMGNDARIIATKKAIDDTQTGLSSQGVMWISSADDLSNLPSGARRFARNNTGVTVLPSADYFFLEVLAKRDVANGSCILATSNTGNVWIGLRYAVPANAAFTWIQLNQNVQNLGLTEAVNRALNAVQKTGDTMTGNLFLKSDGRMHFAIVDEDGNVRMWLYKDKGGDGVRINNGYDGGGEFVFNKNGEFYSPSRLHAGAAIFGNNGDVYGSAWGNTWLTSWITNQLNMRATTGWVNQNFITRMKRGEPVNPGKVNEYGPAEAPAGCVVTSVRHDPTTAYGIYFTYRPLSVFINGAWRVIEG